MNIKIASERRAKYRLTVTPQGEVRIKLKEGADEKAIKEVTDMFSKIAENVLAEGIEVTARGATKKPEMVIKHGLCMYNHNQSKVIGTFRAD